MTPAAEDGATYDRLYAIDPSAFCATAGKVSTVGTDSLKVNTSGMRGVIASNRSRSVELVFAFRGQSAEEAPLANGELRQQIGLKLRAKDTCNLVYVMWHLSPSTEIAVSVKSNPGRATHAECGDRGYINIKPTFNAQAPKVDVGQIHTLRADLEENSLVVHADRTEVWRGTLPPAARMFDGPAGVRTDNGEFEFQLRLPAAEVRPAQCQMAGTELAH